jgi:hypothetical protein
VTEGALDSPLCSLDSKLRNELELVSLIRIRDFKFEHSKSGIYVTVLI